MVTRRGFLAGLMATGALPSATWADVGAPDFLSAAKLPNGNFVLCGIKRSGEIAFQIDLPARGHAAAAHPIKPIAVGFARRPGTFAFVIDCLKGEAIARLKTPHKRHFYGHGAFSNDGDLLFTTENDFENARGVIGVWDVRENYRRIGEFASGGTGPHDMHLMPDGNTLIVANGGIETHPETGRAKLNIPTMHSNLTLLSLNGEVRQKIVLDKEHQRNSIRHLSVSKTGTVAFGMQWQGDLQSDLPLVGKYDSQSNEFELLPQSTIRKMRGYIGSIAISDDGLRIAASSPRSGIVQSFDANGKLTEHNINDASGLAFSHNDIFITAGGGQVFKEQNALTKHQLQWDNHLIKL